MEAVSDQEGGFALRPARPEDHAEFVRMFAALGVEDPPPSMDAWVKELVDKSVFVDGPSGPLAYAVVDVVGGGDIGYVVQLVVDAHARGRGLGRRVMKALAERFRQRGCSQWRLNVKRDNVVARALYESMGMRPAREALTLRVTRAQVEALPRASEPLEVVPVTEEDHAALTEAFALTPGKLAWYATFPSHQLLRLARTGGPEGAAPLGFMDVRVSGGVLYPLFAVTPGHARVLMEDGLSRLGDASVESMRVVVTDDPALVERLQAAGAEVCLDALELRGPLPQP
jgi:ribosomal protein S18 acetylase RimI-like enzyme